MWSDDKFALRDFETNQVDFLFYCAKQIRDGYLRPSK